VIPWRGWGDGRPLKGSFDIFWTLSDPASEPTRPSLPILQLNLIGAFYTFKLGQHYLRVQPEGPERDRCFIFKGSLAGLLDQPGSFQYSASKFALRGLMRSARWTSWQAGIRVNYIAPWYVDHDTYPLHETERNGMARNANLSVPYTTRYTKTTILKPQVLERLVSRGIEFAEVADCTTAVLRIACDKDINGKSLRGLRPS
jgi:NAD(P)-dependent dehydrogenase (short-subunit alcohol dehydrogenase family)